MKKHFISVALFAVLSILAVGCQKEDFVGHTATTEEVGSVRTVLYYVNDEEHRVTLYGEDEWESFVDSMMTLAEQGYDVRIINENAAARKGGVTEVQTMTTTSQSEAKTWSMKKADEGYSVATRYENGQYKCVAVR